MQLRRELIINIEMISVVWESFENFICIYTIKCHSPTGRGVIVPGRSRAAPHIRRPTSNFPAQRQGAPGCCQKVGLLNKAQNMCNCSLINNNSDLDCSVKYCKLKVESKLRSLSYISKQHAVNCIVIFIWVAYCSLLDEFNILDSSTWPVWPEKVGDVSLIVPVHPSRGES
jgi:hypothetical protein